MEILYISKANKEGVELTYEETKVILSVLKPLGDDFIEYAECMLACRFFDLYDLTSSDYNTAYDLIMSADLHERTKEAIKQAFEADARFKVVETT